MKRNCDKKRLVNAGKIAEELKLSTLSRALDFPRFFEIETVNACNARCKICTIRDWQKRSSYLMPAAIWGKFLSEIKDYSGWIDRVNVGRDGEPLLDAGLAAKIKSLKKARIRYVTFATNASLLDEKKSLALLDSGLDDIMFSIDGASKKTFEKIRVGLKFEEVLHNCLNFIKLRDNGNYPATIRVRMVLQDGNMRELKSFLAYWNRLLNKKGDRAYAKPAHSWGNQLKGYAALTRKIAKKDYSSQPCVSPWSTLVLKVNGDVPLCPMDFKCKLKLGNIRAKSLKDIWQAPRLNSVRENLLTGKRDALGLCRNCYLWDRETIVENKMIKTSA